MKASTHSGLNFAPWRLSGTVYGTLLNDPAALAAIGEAANHAPYKAAPRSPVLYLKPRNTLAGHGSHIAVPTGTVHRWASSSAAQPAAYVRRTPSRTSPAGRWWPISAYRTTVSTGPACA